MVTTGQIAGYIYSKTTHLVVKLDGVARAAQHDDLPYECYTAAYGIGFALETGRAGGLVEKKIKAMTRMQLAKLIRDVAVNCPSINDVAGYLNKTLV